MFYAPNVSVIAALIADPARAVMLSTLLDGRALPAGELAYSKVSPRSLPRARCGARRSPPTPRRCGSPAAATTTWPASSRCRHGGCACARIHHAGCRQTLHRDARRLRMVRRHRPRCRGRQAHAARACPPVPRLDRAHASFGRAFGRAVHDDPVRQRLAAPCEGIPRRRDHAQRPRRA
jgi:hypothetical protein